MADQPRTLIERLAAYVAPGAQQAQLDTAFLQECLDEASGLVNRECGITPDPANPDGPALNPYNVPTVEVERAIIETASELFNRSKAPLGITQFATPDGVGSARIARDPLYAARPILAPFLPLGFA